MKKGSYNGLLRAEFLPPLNWKLTSPLIFIPGDVDCFEKYEIELLKEFGIDISDTGIINVHTGFETNLASVPRIFWTLLSPWDIARASVIHDYLYDKCAQKYNDGIEEYKLNTARKLADDIFLMAMNSSEPLVSEWRVKLAYYAVRLFGAKAAQTLT